MDGGVTLTPSSNFGCPVPSLRFNVPMDRPESILSTSWPPLLQPLSRPAATMVVPKLAGRSTLAPSRTPQPLPLPRAPLGEHARWA
jgi:hypothetical protein